MYWKILYLKKVMYLNMEKYGTWTNGKKRSVNLNVKYCLMESFCGVLKIAKSSEISISKILAAITYQLSSALSSLNKRTIYTYLSVQQKIFFKQSLKTSNSTCLNAKLENITLNILSHSSPHFWAPVSVTK